MRIQDPPPGEGPVQKGTVTYAEVERVQGVGAAPGGAITTVSRHPVGLWSSCTRAHGRQAGRAPALCEDCLLGGSQ